MITRLRDILLAGILLLLLSPLWILAMIAIVCESRGNPFYLSDRVGRNGKLFTMLKFRTMYSNGSSLLTPEHNAELQRHFKVSIDPRVTRVGRWLRRSSLDEIPQLVNVLTGDMMLVGPRPKLPEEIGLYGPSKEELLSVLPGMTGYWQVHRTSANSDESMREMDLYYIRHKSAGLDIRLLFRTLMIVFGRGNY
jgi:lipopolysaccharide/colanic/teichoic acid biosynthesis glycosyltransferase